MSEIPVPSSPEHPAIGGDGRLALELKKDAAGLVAAVIQQVDTGLVTDDNKTFGKPAEFNVQSSAVGAVIWVGFAIAGLLVAVAVVRRIAKKRRSAAADG